jgi:4-hydroxybenzoate polyprenyltransferase
MVADALRGSWVHRFLPQAFWPYAQLARWERPIGWRLLMWPCWWSFMLALAASPPRNAGGHFQAVGAVVMASALPLALFLAGAIVMRGAGCTWNDLVDRDIDAKIARTRSRPLPSGRVTPNQAWAFLVLQGLAGLAVLLQFNTTTIAIGLASLGAVVIYPFMKRITWWPQLFLGLAFSWGALTGWPAWTGTPGLAAIVLYAGSILWVIGYDTIYALQDIEDDALVGVRSTARLFGDHVRRAVGLLYAGAIAGFVLSLWLAGIASHAAWPAFAGLAAGGAHMAWQLARLDRADPARALALFKSNSHFGWIVFAGLCGAAILAAAGG